MPSNDKTVLIVGSGPVGCTFARILVKAGLDVTMVDAGGSQWPEKADNTGAHLKNIDIYQRNINAFSGVIKSHLISASVPSRSPETAIDPSSYQYHLNVTGKGTVQNGQNPDQDPATNLGGAAVTYGVGGMGTHWTCATPRAQRPVEYIQVLTDEDQSRNNTEMDRLYGEAEALLHTSSKEFSTSKRQKAILAELQKTYQDAQPLPLAAMREDRTGYKTSRVYWSGPEVILKGGVPYPQDPGAKSIVTDPAPGSFTLESEILCTRLNFDNLEKKITSAELKNLRTGESVNREFNYYVVACGSILTPQLLWASGIRPTAEGEDSPVHEAPAVGKYLCEQTMAFCQIIFSKALVETIKGMPGNTHLSDHPEDPDPIPFDDPEPNLWIPVSDNTSNGHKREWHCQIHRDAFHYGVLPPNVDSRLVVDLRWFSVCEAQESNTVTFSAKRDGNWKITDLLGMPQPTFRFVLSDEDRTRAHAMMEDMVSVAGLLGGFLPQSEPQFLDPGFALHITGTTRLGKDNRDGVVDRSTMAVFGIDNLYLGGGGVIPTGIAANTTLTMMGLAVRTAEFLAGKALGAEVIYQLKAHKVDKDVPEVDVRPAPALAAPDGKVLAGTGHRRIGSE